MLLTLLALSLPPSQAPSDACALLKPADLSALGPTAIPHNSDMEVPSGPGKGQLVRGCMWQIGQQGMIAISVAPSPKDASTRQAGLAMLEQTYNQLKARGWTEEKEDLAGGGKCALLIPPASESDAPITTGCFAEAKGLAVSVSALGKTKVSIEQVKELLGKVVERLR